MKTITRDQRISSLDDRVKGVVESILDDLKFHNLNFDLYETRREEDVQKSMYDSGVELQEVSPLVTGLGIRLMLWDDSKKSYSTNRDLIYLYNMRGSLLTGKYKMRWGKFLKIGGKPRRDYTLFWWEEEDLGNIL
jgi:hypothetical protein